MSYKLNKLHSLYIRASAIAITLSTCSKIIWLSKKNNNPSPKQFDLLLQKWTENLIKLIKAKVSINNPHKIILEKNKRYIIMCNHSSLYDIPLSYKIFPESSIRMLAKKELSRVPIFGSAMKAAGFPFIDRQNRRQAIKDLEQAKQTMLNGVILWISPEGTRSKDGLLKQFKKGAFITAIESEAIIIPLAIKGAFDIYDSNSKVITLEQSISLNIGKPINAKLFTIEQKDELNQQAHQAMVELLK